MKGVKMFTPVPHIMTHYFQADDRRDIDAIVAPFIDDAAIVDGDQTRRGTAGIRGWQEGPASEYQYNAEVIDTERGACTIGMGIGMGDEASHPSGGA
jgi:hypothetical protein